MARFYATFGWTTQSALEAIDLNNGYNRRVIAGSSASAALLRDGLIASRSAVSAAVYDDLAPAFENGALGTFFPREVFTLVGTAYSWSNAYTSSVQGIIVPSEKNAYRVRPTSSVTTASITLLGPATPITSGGLNYNIFLSASNAVGTVLNQIRTATGTSNTPFDRLGVSSSRTLHTIWHDPDLDYFAWDDLTPGNTATLWSITSSTAGGTPLNFIATASSTLTSNESTTAYWNDLNPSGSIGFLLRIQGTPTRTLDLRFGSTSGSLPLNADRSGVGPAQNGGGASTWSWTFANKRLTWTCALANGTYDIQATNMIYYDAVLSGSAGAVGASNTITYNVP